LGIGRGFSFRGRAAAAKKPGTFAPFAAGPNGGSCAACARDPLYEASGRLWADNALAAHASVGPLRRNLRLSEENNSQTQREDDNLQHGDPLFDVISGTTHCYAFPETTL
jgi:hypothetical protein